jgi:hypothetical protein
MVMVHVDRSERHVTSFDGICVYSVSNPVLSLVALPNSPTDSYQLFCLQTTAIQKFLVPVADVRPRSSR